MQINSSVISLRIYNKDLGNKFHDCEHLFLTVIRSVEVMRFILLSILKIFGGRSLQSDYIVIRLGYLLYYIRHTLNSIKKNIMLCYSDNIYY